MDNYQTFELSENDSHLLDNVSEVRRECLTFGVELEFLIAGLADEYEDPNPNDPRSVRGLVGDPSSRKVSPYLLEHIVEVLLKEGVPAEDCVDTKARKPWKVDDPESWVVTTDSTIEYPPLPEDDPRNIYHYHRIEVCSPALYFNETSLAAVAQVCGILSSNFRVQLNWSCALHVHVGRSMKGFDLRAQRKFLATLFTFEPQIQKIHPLAFQSTKEGFYQYAPTLRDWSALRNIPGVRVPQKSDSDMRKSELEREYLTTALNSLFQASSQELQKLAGFKMSTERSDAKMAYNIKNLTDATSGLLGVLLSKRTVEFRQHEGTVDPERVLNWIRFCVGVLEFSDEVEEESLLPFLHRHLELPDASGPAVLNMGEILTALGMYDIAGYYHNIVGVPAPAVDLGELGDIE